GFPRRTRSGTGGPRSCRDRTAVPGSPRRRAPLPLRQLPALAGAGLRSQRSCRRREITAEPLHQLQMADDYDATGQGSEVRLAERRDEFFSTEKVEMDMKYRLPCIRIAVVHCPIT